MRNTDRAQKVNGVNSEVNGAKRHLFTSDWGSDLRRCCEGERVNSETTYHRVRCPEMSRRGKNQRRVEVNSSPVHPVHPRVEHKMRTAAPSLPTARRYGLRRGVALRVWCTCQEGAIQPGGWSFRPRREWEADTRRLGGWDWLGVVDIREPMSALNLWRAHVEESRASEQAYTMDDVESETLGDPQ